MFGIPNVFKKKKVESTETSQKVTTASTTEIDQVVVEDISVDMLMKTKLDFSHRLEHSFKTFLSGIRSSITDIGYRIKSVVMPGRKDTSGEMERLEAVYKNSDARFSYIKTDLDGLDLEPLGVDDTDVVTDKELDLLQDRAKKLSESAAFGSAHTEVMEDTREEKLDTLQGRSEKFRELASENLFLTKKLAEQESNSLSLTGMFKGLFSRSKKQSGTEEYNAGSVNDESSLDHETARKPWY